MHSLEVCCFGFFFKCCAVYELLQLQAHSLLHVSVYPPLSSLLWFCLTMRGSNMILIISVFIVAHSGPCRVCFLGFFSAWRSWEECSPSLEASSLILWKGRGVPKESPTVTSLSKILRHVCDQTNVCWCEISNFCPQFLSSFYTLDLLEFLSMLQEGEKKRELILLPGN